MPRVFLILVYSIALSLSSASLASTLTESPSPVRYDLEVHVLANERRIDVTGSMRIPAADVSRPHVELLLSTLMQDLQVEVLGPGASESPVAVEKVRTEGGWIGHDGKPNQDMVYRIRPARPFPPKEDVRLRFSYTGKDLSGLLLYVGPEVSFATAWGITWYPQERDHSLGVGALTISVPVGEAAIASGIKRSSAEDDARGSFRFEVEIPTLLAFASGKYTVARSDGPIPVSVYSLRPRENMQQYAQGVARILNVLEKEFGPYRFKEFALAEVPRNIAQAAGFNAATMQGFVFVNSNAFNVPAANVNNMAEWYGHEFSHEWWPHVLSFKRPGGNYMEEMLAEYGGGRVVQTLAAPDAAERFRRQGYDPDPIYSALAYFKLVGRGIDGKVGDLPPDPQFRDVAYNKGLFVWDMLSREIGVEKFQEILTAITTRHAFQKITFKEFWNEIEAGAGRKLDWFYEQWFDRTGAPDFALEWKQTEGAVRLVVTQPAPHYRATLEIELVGDQGQRLLRTMNVSGPRTELAVPVEFPVQSVELDPHYFVLRWTPEYRAAAEEARKAK